MEWDQNSFFAMGNNVIQRGKCFVPDNTIGELRNQQAKLTTFEDISKFSQG